MSNGYLTFCALSISIIINLVFHLRKKLENVETNIFRNMLITNLLESIATCSIVIVAILLKNDFLLIILNKVDIIIIIIWISLMYLYMYNITKSKEQKDNGIKTISIINSIFIVLAAIGKVTIINENDIMNSSGFAPTIGLIGAVTYILLILYRIIKNKNINTNKTKYIPIYVLIVMLVFVAIFRIIIPEINLISIILSLVMLIMYFTIENPDVKLIEKIELAKTQAEKANSAKTEFLSSMSHEIRTPLNAIVGFSESISEAETLEEAKENAKDILTASNNLLEIVNGILDISKIEANKMEIVNTEYNLKEEVEKLVKLIKPRIGEKPIEFKIYQAPDIPGVLYGDKGKIKEIMTNILTNAVKYTKEGFIDFKVSCINKNDECSLVISVEDTGRGIKPENIDKLFNKFERMEEDKNTTTEGAGLGLAITKKLVEMMGGKIIVQSVYGSGSKFTVYLKQKIITRTSTQFVNSNNDNSKLTFLDKKVLIVDDNELNIKVAETLLKKYNIKADSCESGLECIEMIKNDNHYDLILMDDMMPKMTGTETLHILQEMPSFKDKTVVLTANAIEGMKEKYIEEGFDDYLAKPIEKSELERVLRKYLNKEKEQINFEPIPDSFYEISDSIVEKLNSEENKNTQ